MDEEIWTVEDVAAYLRVPVQTVYTWRTKDYGPRGERVGRYVRYKAQVVKDWFDAPDKVA